MVRHGRGSLIIGEYLKKLQRRHQRIGWLPQVCRMINALPLDVQIITIHEVSYRAGQWSWIHDWKLTRLKAMPRKWILKKKKNNLIMNKNFQKLSGVATNEHFFGSKQESRNSKNKYKLISTYSSSRRIRTHKLLTEWRLPEIWSPLPFWGLSFTLIRSRWINGELPSLFILLFFLITYNQNLLNRT